MKKKIVFTYGCLCILTCLFFGSLFCDNPLDEFFKNFDLNSFLNEVEKSYDEETAKKDFEATSTPTQSPDQPMSSSQSTTNQKTRDELFLNPTVIPQEKGKSSEILFTQESINAFRDIMHEFISLLSSIATKVDGSSFFSLPFKEEFAKYHETLDKIAVAYGTMVSKKLYSKIIPFKQTPDAKPQADKYAYAPEKKPQPKELENLRQNILDAIKDLKKLDNDLTAAIAHKEPDLIGEDVQELAQTPHETIEFDTTPLTKKSKRTHKPIKD